MSVRLNIDTALHGIDPRLIHPPAGAELIANLGAAAATYQDTVGFLLGREVAIPAFFGERVGHRFVAPHNDWQRGAVQNFENNILQTNDAALAIFRQAANDFAAAQPVVDRIIETTTRLKSERIRDRDPSVKNIKTLLNGLSICAGYCGFSTLLPMQEMPLFSPEVGTVALGTIAGVTIPQAIKAYLYPDHSAADVALLNRLWTQLDPGQPIPMNLQAAGARLEEQVGNNLRTYDYLASCFGVQNPARIIPPEEGDDEGINLIEFFAEFGADEAAAP